MVTKAKSARAAVSRKAPTRTTTSSKTTKAAREKAKATPKATRAKSKPKIEAGPSSSTPAAGPRRAIFIDVENTSSESDLTRVLEELAVDRTSMATDVTAIGNWRVVGQQLGRSLAQRGAHLVHSAPAARVSDWSDLWIAVQAGMWLGRAQPGDVIEIVSHDRAFDAVGDAAARLGVTFRRITYRASQGAAAEREESAVGEGGRARGGRRRRRRGGSGRTGTQASTASSRVVPARPAPPRATAPIVAADDDERHAAPRDHITVALAQLGAADPERGVNLDALAVALKAAGFQRPPGSPRLVTRLRSMKDVELLPNGRVRLVGAVADVASAAHATGEEPVAFAADEPVADAADEADASDVATANGDATPAGKRRRRRGGRRRGGRGRKTAAATPSIGD